jgi:hypothetical protein
MSSVRNRYPDLATVIDVGGDLYDLGASENVNVSHKSRDTFEKTFHRRTYGTLPVEYLLRKYLPVGQAIDKIVFTQTTEYEQLLDVLRRRIQQLRTSEQFSSHVVKNIPIRRYHDRLVEMLTELRRQKAVKKVKLPKLSENELFQVILEMAWYLAHPSEVPVEMEKEWKVVVERLQEQRLSDILETIRRVEQEKGLASEEHPLQYLKRLDMDGVVGANTLASAMERAQEMATVVNAAPIRPDMGRRLRDLMTVLQMKRYVDETAEMNEDGIPMVDPKQLSQRLIANPMEAAISPAGTSGNGVKKAAEVESDHEEKAGPDEVKEPESQEGGRANQKRRQRGGTSMLALPLGQAMLPVFRYLRMLFDPIYSMLEQVTTPSVKKAVLPHLLLLLHLCNELNTPTTTLEFGLYRLTNVPDVLRDFLVENLKETEQHVAEMKTETERVVFQKQLFHLPKVRLRSLVTNTGGIPTLSNTQSVFHLQIFVVGQNLTIPDEATFKKRNPTVDSKVLEVMRRVLEEGDVFVAYTDAATTSENIPFRLFEVDYEGLRVKETGIKITPFSAEWDGLVRDGLLTEDKAYLDQLAVTKPYVVYNDAELALSVLMGLKERMPK